MTTKMPKLELDWDVPPQHFSGRQSNQGDVAMSIAIAIKNEAQRLVSQITPDLEQSFPFNHNFHFHAHYDPAGWFGLRLIFSPGLSMMVGPKMEADDIAYLQGAVRQLSGWSAQDIQIRLGTEWFGPDRFTYVGPYSASRASWSDICQQLLAWMNGVLLLRVLELNAMRVQRAIKPAPSYDIANLFESVWVLECPETCRQGTAFSLANIGLVTCAHSLGPKTHAFRYDRFDEKFPVTVLKRHDVIDLAILSIDAPIADSLEAGDPSAAAQMDNLLVVGHPNYRTGDTPITAPGLVVGFRMRSAIRRLLTNAAIVAGCSGGPVLDRDSRVLGVAVTGADTFAELSNTEDIGIIPIDALSLIDK